MWYLKFTYRFLTCEKMISCCVRDQYDTVALLPALCCHSAFSESQCPDKSFLLREAFAGNVIWGCTEKQLLLLHEHLENSPCAASASGRFLSHICYETYSRTEKFTGSWCQQQEEEASYYLVLQHSSLTELGTGSPAHPKDRAISRQRYYQDCPSTLPSQHAKMPHTQGQGHFLLCPYLTKKGNKEQTLITTASLTALLMHSRQKGS